LLGDAPEDLQSVHFDITSPLASETQKKQGGQSSQYSFRTPHRIFHTFRTSQILRGCQIANHLGFV
jgi:hypothetical protein